MDKRYKLILAIVLLLIAAGVLTWYFTKGTNRPGPVGDSQVGPVEDLPAPDGSGPVRRPEDSGQSIGGRAIGGGPPPGR